MFDIGPEKLLLVLVIALIFLGPQKLPEVARSLGRGLREIRQAGRAAREELMEGLDGEETPHILEGPTSQDSRDESAVEASDGHGVDASASNGSSGTDAPAHQRFDAEHTTGRSG
jgi:sec-independent protein translocase protein TatA